MTTSHLARNGAAGAPRTTLFEEARRRYALGDLASARELLETRRDPGDDAAFLLFVQILIRTGAAARARHDIARRLPDLVSAKNVVRGHLLAAAAALSCDALDDALASLAAARERACVAMEREEEALYRAAVAHRRGENATAREALRIARGSADPAINARAHRLAGDVAVAAGDYATACVEYRRGFSALFGSRPVDDRLLAALAALVTYYEAELEGADLGAMVAALETRAWHPSVHATIGVALHNTGLRLSRRARHAEATAALVRAATLSGESPNAVGALARAAINARDANEPVAAKGFATAVFALADRVAWDAFHPDARDALAGAATLAARFDDLPRARDLLGRYHALAGTDPHRSDVRRALLVEGTAALIAAKTPGARDEGIRDLRRIRREWSRLGFVWRALETRADLYAVTGQRFLLEANRTQRRGLLGTDAPAAPDAPAPDISPQQTRIVSAVARGRSTEEIALELGISTRTVKNQLHKIYQKLEIENPTRERLVAFVHGNPRLALLAAPG